MASVGKNFQEDVEKASIVVIKPCNCAEFYGRDFVTGELWSKLYVCFDCRATELYAEYLAFLQTEI